MSYEPKAPTFGFAIDSLCDLDERRTAASIRSPERVSECMTHLPLYRAPITRPTQDLKLVYSVRGVAALDDEEPSRVNTKATKMSLSDFLTQQIEIVNLAWIGS